MSSNHTQVLRLLVVCFARSEVARLGSVLTTGLGASQQTCPPKLRYLLQEF